MKDFSQKCCCYLSLRKLNALIIDKITGSGLSSQNAQGGDNLRLGPLSPCKCRAKNNHFAGVPRKKLWVQNERVDTNSVVDTKNFFSSSVLPTDF